MSKCPIDNETPCTLKNKESCRGCDKVCLTLMAMKNGGSMNNKNEMSSRLGLSVPQISAITAWTQDTLGGNKYLRRYT